jgi:hypothetical protein
MSADNRQSDFLPEIRVGKIGILKVHQISDDELSRLEQGAGQSLFLNFGIGVLSVAASFIISLLTTTITSDRVFIVFVIVALVGLLAGAVLMILWWCTRKPIRKLAKEIRDRLPPEGEAQQLPPPYPERRADAPPGSGEV